MGDAFIYLLERGALVIGCYRAPSPELGNLLPYVAVGALLRGGEGHGGLALTTRLPAPPGLPPRAALQRGDSLFVLTQHLDDPWERAPAAA